MREGARVREGGVNEGGGGGRKSVISIYFSSSLKVVLLVFWISLATLAPTHEYGIITYSPKRSCWQPWDEIALVAKVTDN